MLLKEVPAETTPAPYDVDATPEPTAEETAEETTEESHKLTECELSWSATTAASKKAPFLRRCAFKSHLCCCWLVDLNRPFPVKVFFTSRRNCRSFTSSTDVPDSVPDSVPHPPPPHSCPKNTPPTSYSIFYRNEGDAHWLLILVEDETVVDYPKVFVQDCADNPEDISEEAVWEVTTSDETGEVVTVRCDKLLA